jgi:F-type H+-transporting ATPase subunit b
MPQLAQLPDIFWSQLFWLAVVFGVIYFAIGRGMLPRIQSAVDAREMKIASDLELAQAVRAEADETEAAYRAAMDASRAEAAALTHEARAASAKDTEAKVKAAAEKIAAKIAKAEAQIRAAAEAARAQVEQVTVEATQDMVAKLTGLNVGREEVLAAMKAEMHG